MDEPKDPIEEEKKEEVVEGQAVEPETPANDGGEAVAVEEGEQKEGEEVKEDEVAPETPADEAKPEAPAEGETQA